MSYQTHPKNDDPYNIRLEKLNLMSLVTCDQASSLFRGGKVQVMSLVTFLFKSLKGKVKIVSIPIIY